MEYKLSARREINAPKPKFPQNGSDSYDNITKGLKHKKYQNIVILHSKRGKKVRKKHPVSLCAFVGRRLLAVVS